MILAKIGLGLVAWHPAMLVATGFGLGRLPGMPGTWGSLAALPVAWAVRSCCGIAGLGVAVVLAFAAGWWASAEVARTSGRADPSFIVIDEIAAQLLVLAATPLDWHLYVAAFLLFRLFDVWKPFPIGWLDRTVRGGFGIMLDDVVAALYALLLLGIGEGALGVRS